MLPENIRKQKVTLIISGGIKWNIVKKRETKSFMIAIKESIISELFKILNYKRNIGRKKFKTEITTSLFFVSF